MLQREDALILIGGGKFTRVDFIKRTNGAHRRMLCRTGVKKNLSGGPPPYDMGHHNLISVWDVQKGAYRTIPVEGILEIKARGNIHQFGEMK